MRFFAKIVAVCNICFIIAVIMRTIEKRPANVNHDAIIPLPFLEGSIAVLGMVVAVILNAAFVFIILFRKSIRRPVYLSAWLIAFNLILFPVEIWYFFFYR